jgi:branched-chain amino acid transport system permease protein
MMAQIFINILIAAGVTTLIALGFALIYQTTHFFDFAYGIILTTGAYGTLFFKEWLHLPLPIAGILAALFSGLLGYGIERFIYRSIRQRGATPLTLLIASLGVYTVLQNVISSIFGDTTRTLRTGSIESGIAFLNARITPVQLAIGIVSLTLVAIVTLFLQKTKIGLAVRAVANNPVLADVCGIDSDRVIAATSTVGSILAGVAGILIGLDIDITPTMGMNAMIAGVVAAIIGGVGSIPGIILGALLLSLAQNIGAAIIGFQWQDTISFIILLGFLFLRPQGFLGRPLKQSSI